MSKKIFSEKEINELSKNKYVKRVSQKGITYTNEFRLHFIAEYEMGKTPRQIFQDAGFDIQVIGIKRIECASDRCRKAYKEKGVLGLDDKRAPNSGRTLNRDLILEEILAKKDAEIEYLKAELELVKKLEISERQVRNHRLKPIKVFGLIKNIISKFNLIRMVKYLCQIADVSTSGYYKFLKSTEFRKYREANDLKAKEIILKAFNHRGYKKGSRSIKMTLENEFGIKYKE